MIHVPAVPEKNSKSAAENKSMKKAGVTILLLCIILWIQASEKLFLLAEDEFHIFLQQDFHRIALSLADRYDSKLSSVPEKGVKPVLKISTVKETESGYETVFFAVKGNVFFVNEKNPVKNLSSAELKQLFSGTFRRWSRTRVPIRQICYYGSEKMVPAIRESDSVPWVRFHNSPMALQMLTLDVTALGIVPFSEAALIVKGTKMLTVDGIAATPETVMNGTYPGAVKYYLSIRKDAPQEIRALYNKLRSKQTKLKLLKAGILPAVEGD